MVCTTSGSWYTCIVFANDLIDREQEQASLRAAFDAGDAAAPQLIVVPGRRRVGKTFLLSRLARERRHVYFAATRQSQAIELDRFAQAIARDLGPDAGALAGGGFPSWDAALRFVEVLSRDTPLVVVLDEVTYLSESTPGWASIVQAFWDHLGPCRLQLVLTGSAVTVLDEMVGADGPLRGRPTLLLRLDPVDVVAARKFLPALEPDALVQAWAVCGGYPQHLLAWDPALTFEQNLDALAGRPTGVLVQSAPDIVREAAGSAAGYSRILASIGRGRHKLSQIASDAGQRVEHPLEVLRRSGLVARELPLGAPRGARATSYGIADHYIAFWYAVLYADEQLVTGGQGSAVLDSRRPAIANHVAAAFEEASRAHAARAVAAGDLPPGATIGRWWTTTGARAEVDVLGLRSGRTTLIGEAKWTTRAPGRELLQRFAMLRDVVPRTTDDVQLALWSRAPASDELRRAGVRVFTAEDVVTA